MLVMKHVFAVLALIALVSGGVPAHASHPSWLCLDIEPEEQRDITNDDVLYMLRAYPGATDAGHPAEHEGCVTGQVEPEQDWGGTTIDFEVTGVSDPDSSDSPATPDMTCTVPQGHYACWVGPSATDAGTQTIRAWIDVDRDDATVEADIDEQQDETTVAGSSAEPDTTDVSLWHWSEIDYTSESAVTIDYRRRPGLFRGQVQSEYGLCTRDRTVKVFKKRRDGKRLLGTSETNDSGVWRLPGFTHARGRFFAVATATSRHAPSPGYEYECVRARSETIRVG